MIWIIGEYAERIDNAHELLEGFVEGFHDENSHVQLQLLTAIVKLFLKRPSSSQELVQQILTLATQVLLFVLVVLVLLLVFLSCTTSHYPTTSHHLTSPHHLTPPHSTLATGQRQSRPEGPRLHLLETFVGRPHCSEGGGAGGEAPHLEGV